MAILAEVSHEGQMTDFSIRRGRLGEEGLILALLTELAEYEKLTAVFHVTAEAIRRDCLGAQPLLNCDLAFAGEAPAGLASWYWRYSSFAARRAIYLEDLYVRPAFRGKGYGKALLAHLAQTAVAAGASRVDWAVLDWNKPSIDFYDSLGARAVTGWHDYRLEGEALTRLGGG
jgi:diamine N-acetyltransferase